MPDTQSQSPSQAQAQAQSPSQAQPFHASVGSAGSTTVLRLTGRLADADVPTLRGLVGQAVAATGRRLVLDVHDLGSVVPAGLRCLAFIQQQLPPTTEVVVEGASPELREALERSGLAQALTVVTATA